MPKVTSASNPSPSGRLQGETLRFGGLPALPGGWRLPAAWPTRRAACPQLSKSWLTRLPDGPMKARLLSMQMVEQVALQLKNDKEVFT